MNINALILCVFSLVPFQNAAVHEAQVTVCPDYSDILRFENALALPQMMYPMEEVPALENSERKEDAEALPTPMLDENLPTDTPIDTPTDAQVEEAKEAERAEEAKKTKDADGENTQTVAEALGGMLDESLDESLEPEIVPESEPTITPKTSPDAVNEWQNPQNPYLAQKPTAPSQEPKPLEIPRNSEAVAVMPIPAQMPLPIATPEQGTMPVQNEVVQVMAVQPVASEATTVAQNEGDDETQIHRPWGVLTFCVFVLLLSVSANIFLAWQLLELRRLKLR